jgi:hypothetical protein
MVKGHDSRGSPSGAMLPSIEHPHESLKSLIINVS